MPELSPLRALRYDPQRVGGDLSAVLAPPYDVLDHKDKSALLSRNERNIVAIDLPHLPPKSLGPPAAYARSAELLQTWRDDGTLMEEPAPALYAYHQVFTHEGKTFTRRMFIARIRLVPFTEGSVLPHEQTFGGPKEDRLALMKATKCQLSPIFGLYTDAEDRVGGALAGTLARKPDVLGTYDDVENRLWVVSDHAVISELTAVMSEKKVYIADGHHRYSTALLYRDFVQEDAGEELPKDHPANFVMFVLASMDDPGCLILPYHRTIADIALSTILDAWAPATQSATPEEADITLYDARTGKQASLRFTKRDVIADLEPKQPKAWHQLDTAYLHRYLIDVLLKSAIAAEPKVHYVKNDDDAKDTARELAGVALLLKPTPMAHLRAVSEAGGLMPQKSTFFYPKLATGLTINPLS